MKTIWTGTGLILEFTTDKQVELNVKETQEFENWVVSTLIKQKALDEEDK